MRISRSIMIDSRRVLSSLRLCFSTALIASLIVSSAVLAAPGSVLNAKDMFYEELKGPAASSAGLGSSAGTTVAYCLELHRGSDPPVLCNNRYPFRSGDGIRLHLKTSAPRYAYIVLMQGSTGKKAILYPPPGSQESNRLEAGKEVLVPPHGLIKFDNNPGTERLGLLLTAEPLETSRALNTPTSSVDANSLTGIPQKVDSYSVYSNDGVYDLGEKSTGNGLVYVHNPNSRTPTGIAIVLNHGNAPAAAGTSRPADTPSHAQQQQPATGPNRPITDKWAFVVGINKFANFPDKELRYCVADAEYLRDFLVKEAGFKPNHVYFLSDEQATKKNILRVMTDLLPKAIRRDDLVLLYFSTHGTPKMKGENFIVTHDFQMDGQNGIAMEKLGDLIKQKIPSDRVVTILDTCFSGNARGLDERAVLDDLLVGSGQIIVSSCGPSETSLEDPRLQHGYFTYYLVDALRSAKLLKQSFDISRDKVVSHTQSEHNHPQHPVVNYDRWKGNDLPIQVPATNPRQ